jgi:hypothetical protein
VWFSLEQLRELPLDPAQRLLLQRQLLETPQPRQSVCDLLVDTSQLNARCCEAALDEGAWLTAVGHLAELAPLVEALSDVFPERGEGLWQAYAALLARVMAAVREALITEEGPEAMPAAPAAELCSAAIAALQQSQELPITLPEWLRQLERFLARRGAQAGEQHFRSTGEASANRQALQLALRLGELHEQVPAWVMQLCQRLFEPLAESIPQAEPFDPDAVAELIGWYERLPLPDSTRQRLKAPLQRARLILELLAPHLVARPQPESREPTSAGPASGQPAQVAAPPPAELVVLPPGTEAREGQLDLAALLAGPEGIDLSASGQKAVDEALDDFCWNLPKGMEARQASESLLASLEPQWAAARRWPAEAWGLVAYAAAAWQRRLGEKLQPLPALDWQEGVMVELQAEELAVLAPLLSDPASLEGLLADMRRLHFDAEFWSTRQEVAWMQMPPPLEALRRLHLNQGFYASAHDPLATLKHWGEGVGEALLASDVWTDDAAGLGHWLAVAQELVTQGKGPLPVLGHPPSTEQILVELADREVVYVGEQAEAVAAAHRSGVCFRGRPFGLRCLAAPDSRHPRRPAGSFSESLSVLLEAVDGLYRQRPFTVLLADAGAYRLPLLHAAHQRYGVSCLSSGLPMAAWMGAAPDQPHQPAPSR